MNGYLKLGDVILGEVNFKVIDETMGVVSGILKPYPEYFSYQNKFQNIVDGKGIVNSSDFEFSVDIPNIDKITDGIGITDVKEYEDIEVEIVAIPYEALIKFN
jgi:hypothetical protein